ncbi:GAF domain-containing protein [Peptococcaceae bacterium 1198_IL3148]
MRWRGFYVLFVLFVLGAGTYVLVDLFPGLDIDWGRELVVMTALIILAEWFAVSFPQGLVSGGFAVVFATFLIYGGEEAVYVVGLSILIGQGIANRGNPLRTTLFNGAQYIISAWVAVCLYTLIGGSPTDRSPLDNIMPLLAFIGGYYAANHLLTYIYQLPRISLYPDITRTDVLKWDALTYLFTVPIGLIMALLYDTIGVTGVVLLFIPVLAIQFILRLYVDLELVNRKLTVLYKISSRLAITDLDKLMDLILKEFRRLANYHTGIFYLWREDKGYFEPVVVNSTYAHQLKKIYVYPGEGFVGRVAESFEPVLIEDTRKDQVLRREPGLSQVMRSLMAVPLVSANGVVGVIVLGSKRVHGFDHQQLNSLNIIGSQAALAVNNAILSDRIRLFFR